MIPTVYYFYRPNCPACVEVGDVMWNGTSAVSWYSMTRQGIKINCDDPDNKVLCDNFGIKTTPAFHMVYTDGTRYEYVGRRDVESFTSFIVNPTVAPKNASSPLDIVNTNSNAAHPSTSNTVYASAASKLAGGN
jgi:hypothetical protein